MILDCHTHIWETPQQLGPHGAEYLRRQSGKAKVTADPAHHLAASECVDKTFVLGLYSRRSGSNVPNELVADYVEQHPEQMIGLAGVDPLADDINDRLAWVEQREAFRGITIGPAGQGFHPADSHVMPVYQFCAEKGLMVMVHQGTHFFGGAMMEFAHPYLWDEVLREFPTLRMIFAHLGHPWVDETIGLLGKHPCLYADIAGLIRRPWHAYNALLRAHEYSVSDKLLFGSDFPFLTASEAIESLYRLNEVTHGTRMPSVPRETLRGIIERDVLAALDIEKPGDRDAAGSADH